MGGVAGAIDPNFMQSSMVIDYVRVYQDDTLSLNDQDTFNVSVYPNPASEVLHIKTDDQINWVEIYDVVGKRVLYISNPHKKVVISALRLTCQTMNLYSWLKGLVGFS